VREGFAQELCCPECGGGLRCAAEEGSGDRIETGLLHCACGGRFPIIGGIPRVLPRDALGPVHAEHEEFFRQHPELQLGAASHPRNDSLRTSRAFGDEWRRFPEIHHIHERIFHWYFEGQPVEWPRLRVLDAGCGMGRWLHFARLQGAQVVGMDVSLAIEIAASRDADDCDFVQSDLRRPPFAPQTFDFVYSLGVIHHLEEPLVGVRALARLLRPGGELRLYVYRTLEAEPAWKRAVLAAVTAVRRLTTRLPYPAVHAMAWLIAATVTPLFLWPHRILRRSGSGARLTRELPLVHYADVPFRMLVAEQFDRLVAPIEGRFRREDVEGWLRDAGLAVVAMLPGLGWRAVARKPRLNGTGA